MYIYNYIHIYCRYCYNMLYVYYRHIGVFPTLIVLAFINHAGSYDQVFDEELLKAVDVAGLRRQDCSAMGL